MAEAAKKSSKAAPAEQPAKKKKPARKKQAEKKSEKRDAPTRKPRLPSPKEAMQWIGMRIDGLENRTLGRVGGILVDVEDGGPRWVIIRLGPIAGCTAIPFDHVAGGGGRLWAAYERDWVRRAPRFKQNEALAAVEEIELCEHWGIREGRGRAAEVESAEDDEITAVPAEG